jgi:hypothetical protein
MSTVSFAEVAEGVRAVLAAYTHALDDGRTDDVVATFCAEGGVDIPRFGKFEGHDALREAYARWKPRRRLRHLVLNTHVRGWNGDEVEAVSDVVVLMKEESGWSVQVVGRYHDRLRHEDGGWRFHHRSAEFVE